MAINLLFGANQIPDLAPGIIREGLANGGIGVPDIPGMAAYYEQWLVVNELEAPAEQTVQGTVGNTEEAPVVDTLESQTWQDRLAADPRSQCGCCGGAGGITHESGGQWLVCNGAFACPLAVD